MATHPRAASIDSITYSDKSKPAEWRQLLTGKTLSLSDQLIGTIVLKSFAGSIFAILRLARRNRDYQRSPGPALAAILRSHSGAVRGWGLGALRSARFCSSRLVPMLNEKSAPSII